MSDNMMRNRLPVDVRMRITSIANDFMGLSSSGYRREQVSELVSLMPLLILPPKQLFRGRREGDGESVQAVAAGAGTVSLHRDDLSSETMRVDDARTHSRFGCWEIQHAPNEIYIEHMWSHYPNSVFAQRQALLLYVGGEDGDIEGSVLGVLVWGYDSIFWLLRIPVLTFWVLKEDGLTPRELRNALIQGELARREAHFKRADRYVIFPLGVLVAAVIVLRVNLIQSEYPLNPDFMTLLQIPLGFVVVYWNYWMKFWLKRSLGLIPLILTFLLLYNALCICVQMVFLL